MPTTPKPLESGTVIITLITKMKDAGKPQTSTLVFALDEDSQASLDLDYLLEQNESGHGFDSAKPTGLVDFVLTLSRVKEVT